MLLTVKGLVVRSVDITESDRLLTLLTAERGKITVCGKGVRSIKSKHMPSAQLFAYSEFVLYQKGDYLWIRESSLIESFFALRSDILRISLATYLCDVAAEITPEDMPEADMLRLALNSLYLLSRGEKPYPLVKAAFEMRAACIGGFHPELDNCGECGRADAERWFLGVFGGMLVCPECRGKLRAPDYDTVGGEGAELYYPVSGGTLDALRYIADAPLEKMFSFSLDDAGMKQLAKICENFLLHHLERGFSTLEFYKSL